MGLIGAGGAAAGPQVAGEHLAPVDAAVWETLAVGPDTFLVRLRDPLDWDEGAGAPNVVGGVESSATLRADSRDVDDRGAAQTRRADRAAVASSVRAAGLARLGVLDTTLGSLTRSGHVTAVTRFPASGVMAVRGDAVAAQTLARHPAIAEIRPDAWRRLANRPGAVAKLNPDQMSPAAMSVGAHVRADRADEVWRRLGVTGEGAVVAVIDTGADWTLPQLVRSYRGRFGAHDYAWFDATGGGADRPFDPHGHGTGVTGIIVGANPDPAGGDAANRDEASGLAPGAEWISVRAFDRTGTARDSWLLAAAEWVLAPTDRSGGHARADLAPDVVNASWVLENGADPLYRPVVAAWRAAGILPVFAAGNDEHGVGPVGSILAPASYPESVGVGGAESDGSPWPFSLGGPSFYGGVAPDLLAPVAVWAPAPGGGTASLVGTSAAAPQVSATAALMLSANPDFTPADLERYLAAGARDAGPAGPDDRYGHGLLDAFASVRGALDAGRIQGSVTDGRGYGLPATLTLTLPGDAAVVVQTAADGTFDAAISEGAWDVRVEAFAFEPAIREVGVEPAVATRLDVAMNRASTHLIGGFVSDESGQRLPTAEVAVFAEGNCPASLCSDETPLAKAAAQPQSGYSLAVPAGWYRLVASAPGRRSMAATTVGFGSVDFILPHAPRIALVDADADLEERVSPYLASAIRGAGFAADTWTADRNVGLDWPPFAYDLIVWSHSAGSPGKLDQRLGGRVATTALSAFVKRGGRLVVSGQRVASLDAQGASPVPAAPEFVRDVLRARFVAGRSANSALTGVGPFAGLDLQMDLPLGYRWGERLGPEVIAPSVDPGDVAEEILTYPDGSGAALASSGSGGRRLFMAFGPEGAGPPADRAALMGRAVEWLSAPSVTVAVIPPKAAPSEVVSVTVTAVGTFTDSNVRLEVSLPPALQLERAYNGLAPARGGAAWEGLLPAGEVLPMYLDARVVGGQSGARDQIVTARLSAHAALDERVAAFRPLSPGFDESKIEAVPARLRTGETASLVLSLRNTGGIDAAAQAELALPAALVADAASVKASSGSARMDLATLRWVGTMGADEVRVTVNVRATGGPSLVEMAARVSGGGVEFTTTPAQVRIGGPVLEPFLAMSVREAEPGDLVTATLRVANSGPSGARAYASLRLPERVRAVRDNRWQGDLPPGGEVVVPFGLVVGGDGPTGALTVTAVVSDALDPAVTAVAQADLTVRSADMRGSSLVMEPSAPVSAGVAGGTLVLVNSGDATASAAVRLAFPPALTVAPSSVVVSAGAASTEAGGIVWVVDVPMGGRAQLTYEAAVARALKPNSYLTVTATIQTRATELRLNSNALANRLSFSSSSLEANPRIRAAGGRVGFTLTLSAVGDIEARDAVLELALPPSLVLDPDSLRGGVETGPSMGTLTWRGRLGAGAPRILNWSATLDPQLDVGARAVVRGVLRASGVDDVDLAAVIGVTSGDFTGSSKRMTPSVAGRGDLVHVVLRAVNSGHDARRATLTDALPAGLVYVADSAWASYGAPEWDETSRSLRWRGEIPAMSAVEVRFAVHMEATERLTNVLQITDDEGTRFAAWADVAPRRATVLLPALVLP